MAISRIDGGMLEANLVRDGVDFAVETDLLYFDVGNGRIGIQTSGPTQALEVVGGTTVDNLSLTTNTISSINVDGDITIDPNGTGNVIIGNYEFDADQTVGIGQDNYVLTYDNATGHITLEPSTAGSSLGALTDVTLSAAADGEILRKSAGDWINNTLTEAEIPRMTVANSAPGTPSEGDLWVDDTTAGEFKIAVYIDTVWEEIVNKNELDRANGDYGLNGGAF